MEASLPVPAWGASNEDSRPLCSKLNDSKDEEEADGLGQAEVKKLAGKIDTCVGSERHNRIENIQKRLFLLFLFLVVKGGEGALANVNQPSKGIATGRKEDHLAGNEQFPDNLKKKECCGRETTRKEFPARAMIERHVKPGSTWQLRRLLQAGEGEVKDNDPNYYGDMVGDKDKEQEKPQDFGETVNKILERLEDIDDPDGKQGRFNETLEKQEAVLETVARVGKHRHKEAPLTEAKPLVSEEGKEAATEDPATASSGNSNKDSTSGEQATWYEQIIGGASDKKAPVNTSLEEHADKGAATAVAPSVADPEEKKEEVESEAQEDVPRLIDSEDNEYVISNPGKGSQMQLQEDLTLISDIVKVIVAAALGGLTCGIFGQPVILGYLAAGMVIGPGGLGLIHELVQVETLAQFGVVFLLFALGVEFSLAKMQGVHMVALAGGAIQIGIAMFLGALLAFTPQQGLFVGAFLSMSSTAVVVKCLMDSNTMNTEHGQIMLGTLILQDCALGLLLAIMPALAAKGSGAATILLALGREVVLLVGFCLIAWLITKTVIPQYLRMLLRLTKYNFELFQLGVVGVCLCVALISEQIGLSLEVGAFVAGLMLSGNPLSEKTLHQIEPIRNIFAALFLASIGMVMHPMFLWQHKDILVAALVVVFFGKACLIAIVVRLFGYRSGTSISVGIALAQIGEFSFVLLSRAQNLGLVSRKMYLLLMGTTALSLVLTPFAFKVVPRLVPSDGAGMRLGSRRSNSNPGAFPNSPVMAPVVISSHREVSESRVSHRWRGGPDGMDADEEANQVSPWAAPSPYGAGGPFTSTASPMPSLSPRGSSPRTVTPFAPGKENNGDVDAVLRPTKPGRDIRAR